MKDLALGEVGMLYRMAIVGILAVLPHGCGELQEEASRTPRSSPMEEELFGTLKTGNLLIQHTPLVTELDLKEWSRLQGSRSESDSVWSRTAVDRLRKGVQQNARDVHEEGIRFGLDWRKARLLRVDSFPRSAPEARGPLILAIRDDDVYLQIMVRLGRIPARARTFLSYTSAPFFILSSSSGKGATQMVHFKARDPHDRLEADFEISFGGASGDGVRAADLLCGEEKLWSAAVHTFRDQIIELIIGEDYRISSPQENEALHRFNGGAKEAAVLAIEQQFAEWLTSQYGSRGLSTKDMKIRCRTIQAVEE